MDWKNLKNRVRNLIKKTTKLPWFKVALILCAIVVLWQFVAIREELKSVKTEVALAKAYTLAAGSSSYLESRVDDLESTVDGYYGTGLKSRVDDLEISISSMKSNLSNLESSLSNVESTVSGIYGLESRIDDLEFTVSDLQLRLLYSP